MPPEHRESATIQGLGFIESSKPVQYTSPGSGIGWQSGGARFPGTDGGFRRRGVHGVPPARNGSAHAPSRRGCDGWWRFQRVHAERLLENRQSAAVELLGIVKPPGVFVL